MRAAAAGRDPSAYALVALVCVAQVLAQIGAYTWPALLPGFLSAWEIDNSEAGWITGLFYAAYTVSVPVLVSLTDRVDPKRVYLMGVALTVAGHLCFALFAEGFWSAAAARVLAGIGWAGTYMTGLKLLADRVEGRLMSRAVAGHAAGIGIAGALSFAFAGSLDAVAGWRAAFAGAAGCAAVAWLLVFLFVPVGRKPEPAGSAPRLFDFGPVFKNRSAMAYACAYCVHTWEMNVLRGWAVAFLAFTALRTGEEPGWLAPTVAVTVLGLVGTAASVAGNELAIRLGRQKLVRLAMVGSVLCAALIGYVGSLSYYVATPLLVLYAAIIWADSSALTAGAAGSAEEGRRGATLAVHSTLGYAGGFVGPLLTGWLLDWSGGMSTFGWTVAFLHVALVMLAGRVAFVLLRPDSLPGDRSA